MNKKRIALKRLIWVFLGCIIINVGLSQVYTVQAKPRSGSSRSSSRRSSSSMSKRSSGKVSSGSFSSKSSSKPSTSTSKSSNKINSGSFSTSKPKGTQSSNTYTGYGGTTINSPSPFFTGGLFNSWYYRMPILRYTSPAVLVTIIILIGLFAYYWWWRRHL